MATTVTAAMAATAATAAIVAMVVITAATAASAMVAATAIAVALPPASRPLMPPPLRRLALPPRPRPRSSPVGLAASSVHSGRMIALRFSDLFLRAVANPCCGTLAAANLEVR